MTLSKAHAPTCAAGPTCAFTLIEVLVALALTALLTSAVFFFIADLHARRDSLLAISTNSRSAEVLFDRIEDDLTAAVAGDPRAGAGVVGSPTELRLLSRRSLAAEELHGSLSRAAYSFSSARAAVTATAEPLTPPAASADELSFPSTDPPAAQPQTADLCANVRRLRFRYFDGRAWRDQFDSLSAQSLPVAVEIALWFGTRPSTQPPSPPPDPADRPRGEPDRRRIVIIPDGPLASWKEPP